MSYKHEEAGWCLVLGRIKQIKGRWEMGVLFYVTWSERASLLAGAEGVREEGRRDYSLQSWGAVK